MMNAFEPVAFEGFEIRVNGVYMNSQRLRNVGAFPTRGIQHHHLRTASLPRGKFPLQHRVQVINMKRCRC